MKKTLLIVATMFAAFISADLMGMSWLRDSMQRFVALVMTFVGLT